MRRVLALVATAAFLAGCTPPAPSSPAAAPLPQDPGRELAAKVTADAMFTHLRKFADIAAADKGTRAEGTPGFDASVDYVSNFLRAKGFDVQVQDYVRLAPGPRGNPALQLGTRTLPVDQASLLTPTAPGGLTAPAARPLKPAGCAAGDYDKVDVHGAIAVVDDTGCSVVDKQNVAVGRGAAAVLVVSVPRGNGSPRTLFPSGYYEQLTTPVGIIGAAADDALRATKAPVHLTLDGRSGSIKSRNVLAQTKTGDRHNVVMVGTHLDSAPDSAGINDAATGVSALLEAAAALGGSPSAPNSVRFSFWGSGAGNMEGSTKYVRGLAQDALDDIAMYLDFDTLGSSNAGYFTYDGDQSGQPNPAIPLAKVPAGSAGVERTLAGYLNLAGKRPADMELSLANDYGVFLSAGVPIGGVTTGTVQRKNEAQARLWGGQAGVAFDPVFRTQRDNLDSVNRAALAVTGPAVAFAVGTYAYSLGGVNGVPTRDQRHHLPAP